MVRYFHRLSVLSRGAHTDSDKDVEKLNAELQELRSALERAQQQQSEDSRSVTKLQKNTERYLAKKQMLTARKDECNRNIRDLGVLPEEAFEKYTNEKLDRVRDGDDVVKQTLADTDHVVSWSRNFTP